MKTLEDIKSIVESRRQKLSNVRHERHSKIFWRHIVIEQAILCMFIKQYEILRCEYFEKNVSFGICLGLYRTRIYTF